MRIRLGHVGNIRKRDTAASKVPGRRKPQEKRGSEGKAEPSGCFQSQAVHGCAKTDTRTPVLHGWRGNVLIRSSTMSDLRLPATFVRTFAHDLDNVLAGVSGALEIVASQAVAGPAAEFARAALADLSRAQALIRDAVTFAAPPPLDRRLIDIARVVNEATSRVAPAARRRRVQLNVAPDVGGTLLGDADQIARVIAEVVQNAVEASPEEGEVRLRSRATSMETLIEIEDEGAEQPDERAFEPFFSRKRGHAGLGLSIAKQIVEAHGGSIELQAVNAVTRARIRLPRGVTTAALDASASRSA